MGGIRRKVFPRMPKQTRMPKLPLPVYEYAKNSLINIVKLHGPIKFQDLWSRAKKGETPAAPELRTKMECLKMLNHIPRSLMRRRCLERGPPRLYEYWLPQTDVERKERTLRTLAILEANKNRKRADPKP